MSPSRVVVDIDGCLADFDRAGCDRFGWDCDRAVYSYSARWPGRQDEIEAFVASPATYASLWPIPGSLEFVGRLRLRHELYYVTARPLTTDMWAVTLDWLDQYGYPPGFVRLVDPAHKAKVVVQLDAAWALDDTPSQIEALRKMGVPTVVVDQPWNRQVPGPRLRFD